MAYVAIHLKLMWRYPLTTRPLQVLRGWPKVEIEEVPLEQIDDIVV